MTQLGRFDRHGQRLRPLCPRCNCCDTEDRDDGSMMCIGRCDSAGVHEPETAEEWREFVAIKDAEIASLRQQITSTR